MRDYQAEDKTDSDPHNQESNERSIHMELLSSYENITQLHSI